MQNSLLLQEMTTNKGENLLELSKEQPVLLVFLRHFGCIFCREAMKDVAGKRDSFQDKGVKIVMVHMSDNTTADEYFNNYGLPGISHISDPDCKYYAAFGLAKGSFSQLFGLKNLIRGIELSAKGNLPTFRQIGDGFQMPGIFMIRNKRIVDSYIHKTAADRPDYESIIACCAE